MVTIQGSSVGYVVMMAIIIEAKIRVEVVRINYVFVTRGCRKEDCYKMIMWSKLLYTLSLY